ncbi:MAG TPA: hypothetical protein VJS12_03845 [Steroidobacteraceae bacterium]|nr:hypothetical protein [Steroidobacteraceae bacterium]
MASVLLISWIAKKKRPASGEVPWRCGYACGVYWFLAAIFILVALTNPRLRPLGIVGCVVLGVMLGWGVVQRLRSEDATATTAAQQRGRPSSPASAPHSIPLSMVAAENLRLSGGGAPFELRGRIVNSARDAALKSVTIRVTRRDCYEGAVDPSGCVKLWQDDHWIAVAVPASQARDFVDSIWMHGNAPRARGTVQDVFELIAATGDLEPAVEKKQD